MKFHGTFSDLEQIVARLGIPGTWSGKNPHEYILVDKTAKLRWWPSTGTIYIDGKPTVRDAFTAMISVAIPSIEIVWPTNTGKDNARES